MERKRQKLKEHAHEVERLWQIKVEQYRKAKEEEMREMEQQRLI